MDLLGTKLSDRYEIVRELGRGGLGVVYLARDPLLDRDVAVKLVPPHLFGPDAEARFRREARVVARMDHPGVVTVYDVGEHGGSLFYVMPVVAGSRLRELLATRALRLGEVLDIGMQVADALDHSHALGVVHRDLRPENVTIASSEGEAIRVRIMDFGLAQASFESQLTRITQTTSLGASVAYLSPEQIEGREADARSDLYALGVMLYECLTGAPPFVGSADEVLYRTVHEMPTRPSDAGLAVDGPLEEIVLRCLAKDPERRPQLAREVVEGLERYRGRLRTDEHSRVVLGGRGTRGSARDMLPFFGRERELDELQSSLAVAIGGDARFALVAGEAGIGKSRLLNEVERAARARRAVVLRGRFVAEDRGFPFQGFCEVIQEYYRVRDSLGVDADVVGLEDLAADLVRLFPVLAEIPDLARGVEAASVGDDDLRRLDDRTAVFELLARSLARLASARPLVVLFEDLHDADVSIEALHYVVRRIASSPIFVAGSYRPSEVDRRHPLQRALESFRGDRRFSIVSLGPLAPAEHRALIEAMLDYARVTDSLAETLYAATEGNPFFTIELVRSLVDSGGIAEDEGGLLALSSEIGISSDALPETIQQVVERQIERLPEDLRDVLSIAAVLGRTFESRDLESLADGCDDVEDAIERLLREGLLEEREWRGDRLAFASRVVRDALYARLPRRRRRALHRRFAEYLEERYAGRLDRVYRPLLHHYSLADVPDKAVEYGFQAALKALDAFSAEDAITSIRTALEFLGDEEWEGDASLEGESRLVLAGAFRIQGNFADALREAERAVGIFERASQDAQALRAELMAAEVAWDGRKIEDTRRWVERGVERARALEDSWTRVRLLTLGATVANLRGEVDTAHEYLEEAARLRGPVDRRRVPRGGTLVVGLNNPIPIATEPALVKTGDDEEVLANVFERLVTTDDGGNLVPALCERWELLDGGATFAITLRTGEVFSDGSPVTASEVKRSFEHCIRVTRGSAPAAFASIHGAAEFLAGRASDLAGVSVRSDTELLIRLAEALPIYPALLADVSTSIVREAPDGSFHGSGPFRVARRDHGVVTLDRNSEHPRAGPNLDAVEFRTGLGPIDVAERFRAGELDVVRGLADEDAERVLRDARYRARLVDGPRKETCFVVFNATSGALADARVRRALAGVVRVQPLVWATLGRRALPATGLVPPGMLGHDPGRKLPALDRDRAIEMLREAGTGSELRLTAAVSPKFNETQGALIAGLFETWADVGVRVAITTPTVGAYLDAMDEPGDVDLLFARWTADYDDPDNFTHGIFHSRTGSFRRWYASPELDDIAEQARAETRPVVRETLYRRFEACLLEAGAVVPLFHAIDSRLVGRHVRGLVTSTAPPFVNYAELGKELAAERRMVAEPSGGGTIRIALSSGQVRSLDPALVVNTEMSEVVPNVFETLTRVDEGARIVPWLAAEYHTEDGGRRFRFRLRTDVRFHDGRRLTARDVRYSFERLLQQRRARTTRSTLLPVRGARALVDGAAGDLEGFRIHSAAEFSVELETPLPFFAGLLTDPCTAIVPEGQHRFDASWRDQCAGTGPFRVTSFEPGVRIELERNPGYWREGFPRADALAFLFGMTPEEVLAEFRAGRLSLATNLLPADVEALRHDPEFAPRYYESPSLAVAFMAFNTRRGPLANVELRRRVARAADVDGAVRRALGRFVRPANSVILPGLVGHDASRAGRPTPERMEPEIELTVAVAGGFARTLGRLWEELVEGFRMNGVRLRAITPTAAELDEMRESASVDMIWTVWVADYPDTDGLVGAVLHSTDGAYGRYCGTSEVDRLVERGRTETDVATRHALYRQLEAVIARDVVVLPLLHPHNYRFARPEVEGVACSSLSYPVVAYENLRIR